MSDFENGKRIWPGVSEKLYWIGPRESDIDAVRSMFSGSVTLFGSGMNGNRAFCSETHLPERMDHNTDNDDADRFLLEEAIAILDHDPDAKFMFYNGNAFYGGPFRNIKEKYAENFLCLNDEVLMRDLNNKNYFHDTFKNRLNVLDVESFNLADCDYHNVAKRFGGRATPGCRFVFQAPVASGGSGTFILDHENEDEIAKRAEVKENYLVSVFQENNISVNIHAIIYDEEILLSPGSVQIMREDDYRLMYRGADFFAYRQLDKAMRDTFEEYALKAAATFQQRGYRGVCGIDAIFTNDQVFLLEVNNRFQASTNLLNYALLNGGFKSVQEMNYEAFTVGRPQPGDEQMKDIDVNYSNFSFIYNGTNEHCLRLFDRCADSPCVVGVDADGFNRAYKDGSFAANSHLFRVNFNTNITWINEDHELNIHENIFDPSRKWMNKIRNFDKSKENLLALKIALMTQGLIFSDDALRYLDQHGSYRIATNNAVDIKISDIRVAEIGSGKKSRKLMTVNCPIRIKFSEFAPFTFDIFHARNGKDYPILVYYDTPLMLIMPHRYDTLSERVTKSGLSYSKVAFLSTDRLRVHITNHCSYKDSGVGCKFCNMSVDHDEITLDDIREVVGAYHRECKEVSHYLVGGQSDGGSHSEEKLIKTVEVIREISPQAKIYVMILPCSQECLDRLVASGVTEIGHNIEIFDADCAVKYMPGKGVIPRETYFKALSNAYFRSSVPGNIRSLVVVGLEKEESMYNGIRRLAEQNIQPILSVFRPLPETELKDVVPPSMRKLAEIYLKSEDICLKHHLHLGPSCPSCQNNTLSMKYDAE